MTVQTVFISAVSSELREYRLALAQDLRTAGYKVILQEELRYDADTLLEVLENAIRSSQFAICLVGSGSGAAFPSVKEGTPYAHRLPPAQDRASHTQWEVILARHHGLHPLFYYPSGTLTLPPLSEKDDPALQARFTAWLDEEGVPRQTFDGKRDLAAKVLAQLHRIQNPTGPATHGLPPSLGTRFVGRDDFMDRLRQSLTTTGTTAITAAITGMGGVGKTRVAAEYAWANQDRYHDALLMIPAESAEAIQSNLSALTTPLGLPGMEQRPVPDRVAAVLGWLRARRDWLLILDHVDTESGLQAAYDLRGAVPTGHILLTTRQGTVPDGSADLALDVLSPQASVALLLGATAGKRAMAADDDAQAAALAAALGHLALALTHAAAHIARHGLGFAAYRAELDRRFEAMLAVQGKSVRDHTDSTLATLEISLGRATPGGLALLERLAFLADEPVPRALLDVKVPGAGAEDLREAEADLADYSLLMRDMATDVLTTHRLVRELVRRRLTPETARTRLEQALRWVDDAFEGHPQDARTWPRLLPLAEHAEVVALAAEQAGIDEPTGRLMAALGVLFDARAQYGRAERLKRAAVEIGERSLGPDHPEVATRLNNLAGLLYRTNRLSEAEPLYRRALAIDEANYGSDHPEVATDLNNLAALLEATNRLSEAEPLYRRALVIDETSLGPDHPHVATRLNNLAGLLRATNRLSEAEPLYRRALAISEASLGRDHPTVAGGLNNLAGLLRATNRLSEAEPLYRRALAIDEASLGPDHPNVGFSVGNLAGVLEATNRLAEAEPLRRRALAIHEASLGPDHPHVATGLNNLAELLRATNRLSEAEPLYRRALAISEASLGPDHPQVASGLNNLAFLLQATNRLSEAEPLYRRALAIDEASQGPDHPNVAIRLNNLAALLQATNRLSEAEPLSRRMVLIFLKFQRDTGHAHPNRDAALRNYTAILQALGRTQAEIIAELRALLAEAGLEGL